MNAMNGSVLKIIALVTMCIDHVGASVLRAMWQNGHPEVYSVYAVLRHIGRVSFPIFIFLLIEGFLHTRNKKNYAIRLFIFSLVSEVPFDLAFQQTVLEWRNQNVFLTLFIGFLVIWGIATLDQKLTVSEKVPLEAKQVLSVFGRVFVIFLGALVANLLKTDYAAIGVMAIAVGYMLRVHPVSIVQKYSSIGICLVLIGGYPNSEMWCLFSLIPLFLYNNKKGKLPKWVGYAFYPCHLLIMAAILVGMGYLSLGR